MGRLSFLLGLFLLIRGIHRHRFHARHWDHGNAIAAGHLHQVIFEVRCDWRGGVQGEDLISVVYSPGLQIVDRIMFGHPTCIIVYLVALSLAQEWRVFAGSLCCSEYVLILGHPEDVIDIMVLLIIGHYR